MIRQLLSGFFETMAAIFRINDGDNVAGRNLFISSNLVIIDGVEYDMKGVPPVKLEIVNGSLDTLRVYGNAYVAEAVTVKTVDASGNVVCGPVTGDVDASGDVTVHGSVGGNVDSSSDVTVTGSVGGYVDASGDVRCGDVGQYVESSGDVEAGDVNGNIDASGDVTCGGINGNIDASGDVTVNTGRPA
jgi:autotransporter translocation and assembly factor TamB